MDNYDVISETVKTSGIVEKYKSLYSAFRNVEKPEFDFMGTIAWDKTLTLLIKEYASVGDKTNPKYFKIMEKYLEKEVFLSQSI